MWAYALLLLSPWITWPLQDISAHGSRLPREFSHEKMFLATLSKFHGLAGSECGTERLKGETPYFY